jgi:arylsulfatase A-like enzyme
MSIMSGQYVTTHGMSGNGSSSDALVDTETLPSQLQKLGYQTAAIGKMHFTPQRARHGFGEMLIPDDYYKALRRSGSHVQPMAHGLGQNELFPGMSTVPESMTLTSWIAEQSADYIVDRRDPTKPFFLWCSFSKPHPPLDPPEPYYSMYRDEVIPEPVRGDWSVGDRLPPVMTRFWQRQSYDLLPPTLINAARKAYYGLITQIDYAIGRVFAALQDVKLFDDTLIIFASDHGEFIGDHGGGSKVFCHEPSAHIPFILRLPKSWDNRAPGSIVSTAVTLADVLPTLVTAAGGRPAESADGTDLISIARGDTESNRKYVVMLAEGSGSAPDAVPGIPTYIALTDGHWKYCWYPEGPAEHLFDLDNDPHELHDLSGKEEMGSQKSGLRQALLKEVRLRNCGWLRNDDLPHFPRVEDPEADRRNASWPGYHSTSYPVDVRH